MRIFFVSVGLIVCLEASGASKIGDEVLGLRFGATLEEVKRAHPGGAVVNDFYTVKNFSATFETVAFGFTRTGRLCRVNRWYTNEYVKQLAKGDLVKGLKELTSLLLAEYGPSQPMHKSGEGTTRDPLVISQSLVQGQALSAIVLCRLVRTCVKLCPAQFIECGGRPPAVTQCPV